MKNPELSIVIVNYNSWHVLKDCLESLNKVKNEVKFEVIIIDNNSSDESVANIEEKFPWLDLYVNPENKGFGAANNMAQKVAKGRYILFLNPDTVVDKNTLKKTARYIKKHAGVGAVTCKMLLPDGSLDRDARRSFPTPWVSLSHFLYLDRLFPSSKLFSKYWYGFRSPDKTQEIDVFQAAYIMIEKKLLDKIGWFDEDYFLDGEDVDLSWRIWQAGKKIVYLADTSILHVKKASKKASGKKNIQSIIAGTSGMKLFYKKHLKNSYPFFVNWAVYLGIWMITLIRIVANLFK